VSDARYRRPRAVRAKTLNVYRIPKRTLAADRDAYPEPVDHPRTRAECERGPRPCPLVGCRHNLYLDVKPNGSIKLNFPDLDVDQIGESCALDVADRGGATLEIVGALMNLTRERVRQIEAKALDRFAGVARRHLRVVA
jgi:Sigma-70, region 4